MLSDLTLPDGTRVTNVPVSFLAHLDCLALRCVSKGVQGALRVLAPEWRLVSEWCVAVGHCVAPLRWALGDCHPCSCGQRKERSGGVPGVTTFLREA